MDESTPEELEAFDRKCQEIALGCMEAKAFDDHGEHVSAWYDMSIWDEFGIDEEHSMSDRAWENYNKARGVFYTYMVEARNAIRKGEG